VPVLHDARVAEVLYETEAALRLVARGLDGLHEGGLPDAAPSADEPAVAGGCATTPERLRAVRVMTEDGARHILDACDRAARLVDALDALDSAAAAPAAASAADRARAAALRAGLRDELAAMMGALQFEDLAAQHLAHASESLVALERQLDALTRLDDGDDPPAGGPAERAAARPLMHRDGRSAQGLADRLFASHRVPAA
jgi:hypothetical protein